MEEIGKYTCECPYANMIESDDKLRFQPTHQKKKKMGRKKNFYLKELSDSEIIQVWPMKKGMK